jgi:hypothetical protein
MNQNQEMLFRNFNELIELRHVLQKDGSFFDESVEFERDQDSDYQSKPLVEKTGESISRNVKLGYCCKLALLTVIQVCYWCYC